MKAQDQVCTYEQAKRLKEIGVTADSIFCYIGDDNPDPKYHEPQKLYYSENAFSEVGASWYEHRKHAYTVAELGEMLPTGFDTMRISEGWCGYNDNWEDCPPEHSRFKTEAECRAAMVIHLCAKSPSLVEEINKRLNPIQ